jgi:hypothetical protein
MENWIFLLLGLILAYLLEFTRPWTKSTYDRSVFASKKKKIVKLIMDYKMTDGLGENNSFINVVLFVYVGTLILELAILVMIVGFIIIDGFYQPKATPIVSNWFGKIIIISTFLIMARTFYSIIDMGNRIFDTENYKKKIIEKLVRLGVNTEDLDLDKEKTVGG